MVDGSVLAEWVGRLVRLPSVSPSHSGPRAGTPGEARIAAQVAAWFLELGAEVEVEEVLPGRPNVYGIWRGRSERWAGLDVHTDTVSVEQMSGEPFGGELRGGRVHGRGAVDTKASLGVALALLEAARRDDRTPGPNLLVAATVDEEDGARGAPALAEWLRRRGRVLDELAVAEPTECAPIIAHKGVLRLEVHLEGEPAHSSQPHLGRNAITAAARVALALDEENRRLQEGPGPPPLGAGTLTVTMIHGGRGMNVVPDRCTLAIDRRLVAGERGETVAAGIRQVIESASPLPCSLGLVKSIHAFAQDPDAAWVRQLSAWSGQAPAVAPYCTNAWAYPDVARARVVIGPGSINQAHGVEEWVEMSELEKMAGVYTRWWDLG